MKPPGGFEGIVIKSGEYCKKFAIAAWLMALEKV
jgi:hypothetical protein